MKEEPHHHVIVSGFHGEDGYIQVVCCLGPDRIYASKNQKHVGFVEQGIFIPDAERGHTVSVYDAVFIEMVSEYLQRTLLTIAEKNKEMPTSTTA